MIDDLETQLREEFNLVVLDMQERFSNREELAEKLQEWLTKKNPGNWHVFVGNNFASYVTQEDRHYY